MVGVFALTQSVFADFVPLNPSNPEPLKFLDVSATNQLKQGWLGLGFTPGSYNPLATLDVKNTTFTSALSVLGKAWNSGRMLVGYNSIPAQLTNSLMVAQDHIRSSLLAGNGTRPVCSDANGNFVMCSNAQQATPQVVSTSPLCGSAANTFATAAPGANLCSNSQQLGSVTYQQNGAYLWKCFGYVNNNPVIDECRTSPLPPTCGQAAYVATTSAPTANRCLSGTPSPVTGGTNGVYSWTCSDTFGNPPVTCTTPANNTTPTKPENCFAMYGSAYNRAVLTCANGSPSATRYEIQVYNNAAGWWTNTDFITPDEKHSVPAMNATPTSAGVGSWVNTLIQELPTAIMISQFNFGGTTYIDNYNSGAAYVWRIRGCNGTNNCGPYSDPIYPGPFYNEFWQTQFNLQYQPNFSMSQEPGGKLRFSWEKPPNEPAAGALYPTLYIRRCTNQACIASGSSSGFMGGFQLEPVDPTTLIGSPDLIAHGPISCTANNICSVVTTNPESASADYMLTLGKNLYNDALPGPTSTAANQNLTGYLSTWDQFSPWYAIDN